jgi:hypothetical protein
MKEYTISCECGRVHRVYVEKGKVKHDTEEEPGLIELLTGDNKKETENDG